MNDNGKVESMSRKSLDDILSDVDEPEMTLDEAPEAETKVETDEAEDTPDEPDKAAAKSDTPTDKADPEDKKDGLPPWMHARVKSATEAKTAAERRAEEAERRIAEYEARQQQNGQYHEPTVADYLGEMERKMAEAQQTQKVVTSKRFAVQEFGAEEVERALAWAKDQCDASPQFNQQLWASSDPAFDAVREFRKAQTFVELDKYGGDINKLIEAKLAERGAVQTDETPSPQAQPNKKMPGNFSGSPSARTGRSGPAFTGPTPLSDLLK